MSTQRKRKIVLIYVDSGGGHRAAANALRQVISGQGWPWNIELECIQDLLDPIDFIRKYTGIPFQEVYNILLRHGWTWGSEYLIRRSHRSQVRVLERHWSSSRPDLVVSLIPHYNRSLRESLANACPGVPY